MSLDKAIEHGKEKRRPYHGSKAIDKSCRNHGSCDWCRENRMYRTNKSVEKMNEIENEYIDSISQSNSIGEN